MSGARRILAITALVIAGESVFLLPFVLQRVFRPTLLEVFDLTNLELGTAFAVYGVVAMAAYFFGGPLADRFPARNLLAIALASTAAGGLVMMTVPSHSTLVLLYAYWGFTTMALLWAPMIRATREWGGETEQGRAFGLLDGGRGLLAATMGSVMVLLFAGFLPEDPSTANITEKTEALRRVILAMSGITLAAAVLVMLALPYSDPSDGGSHQPLSMEGVRRVATMPSVWLQAAIILCAYVGFKAIDDFSLYANQVVGLDEVDAARAGVLSLWIRPFAAVGAGLLADRIGATTMTASSFGFLAFGSLILASGLIGSGMVWVFLLTIVCSSIGIFALRGLYFAIMREGKVPLAYTGATVGLVSMIGYTPDVFMGPLMGYLLDQSPGALGHQHVFWIVTGFAVLGLLASWRFAKVTSKMR
ncbi:MAG: MFS transporter [Methyloceanibacter sp.]|jgi:nitrate/nitrite transporter NarK